MSQVNGIAVASAGIGLVFIWSGLKGASILSTIQSVIQGKKPTGSPVHTISAPSEASATTSSTGANPSSTLTGGSRAANKTLGQSLCASVGWTGSEWDAFNSVVMDESGWSNTAANPSGAYGIAQSLPASKYPPAGRPPSQGGTSDAKTQIIWMIGYIKSRYGTPSAALAHENSYHWY